MEPNRSGPGTSKRVSRLVVGVIVISVLALMALPLLARLPGWSQRKAIAEIKKTRAALEFDGYQNVVSMQIPPGCPLTVLALVPDLPNLKKLTMPVTDATDDDLKPLIDSHAIEELILSGNKAITDVGLKTLANLTNLRSLYLTEVPVTGSSIEALKGQTKIKELNVAYSKLDVDGLAQLSAFPELEFLDIGYTPCTDAIYTAIIEENGAEKVAPMLEPLRQLPKLKTIWIMDPKSNRNLGAQLQKMLPNMTVKCGL